MRPPGSRASVPARARMQDRCSMGSRPTERTRRKAAVPNRPTRSPRRTSSAPGSPSSRCVNRVRMETYTGNVATTPLVCGPSNGATAVIPTTRHVPIATRAGRSHRGCAAAARRAPEGGRTRSANPREPTTARKRSHGGASRTGWTSSPIAPNAATASRMPRRGPERVSPAANASVNPAIAMRPISDPTAEVAANDVPRSSARKNVTGPLVSGSETSQPPIAGPQRRAARLAPPMSTGVRTSFRARIGMPPA